MQSYGIDLSVSDIPREYDIDLDMLENNDIYELVTYDKPDFFTDDLYRLVQVFFLPLHFPDKG